MKPLFTLLIVLISFSLNAQFLPNQSWTTYPYFGTIGNHFVDVNGDGRADAVVVNNDKVRVRPSSGSQFLPDQSWTTYPYYGTRGTYFADVNGDGRADAIVVNNDRVTVLRSPKLKRKRIARAIVIIND